MAQQVQTALAPGRGRARTMLKVQNITAYPQSVIDEEGVCGEPGRRYELPPYQVSDVLLHLGRLFLDQRAGRVQLYSPVEIPSIPGEDKLWIANATGNPFLPKKISLARITKGEKTSTEVDNPLYEPITITYEMAGGQQLIPTPKGDDNEMVNLPPIIFCLPPFTRWLVSRSYHGFLMARDARQESWHRGKLVECPEPVTPEPNETWKVNELQIYADAIDPTIKAKFPEIYGKPVEEYGNVGEREDQARLLARALWFRLIDVNYNPPSEKAFIEFKRQKEETRAWARKKQRAEEAKAAGGSNAEMPPEVIDPDGSDADATVSV